MTEPLAVNRERSAKKKPRGKPFTGKGDPRNNINGAPKRGESWAELFTSIGNMTGDEVSALAKNMGRKFKKLPKDVTVKSLTVIRVYGALLNDPQPGLLNIAIDRAEGKVKDEIELNGNSDNPLKVIVEYVDREPAEIASGAEVDQD